MGEKVNIEDEDLLAYRVDYENRVNSLKAYYSVEFWNLPKQDGESKLVFFLEYDGHVYFGMSLYLRIGYPHKISEELPVIDKKLLEETLFLDYTYAMFWLAEQDCASYTDQE